MARGRYIKDLRKIEVVWPEDTENVLKEVPEKREAKEEGKKEVKKGKVADDVIDLQISEDDQRDLLGPLFEAKEGDVFLDLFAHATEEFWASGRNTWPPLPDAPPPALPPLPPGSPPDIYDAETVPCTYYDDITSSPEFSPIPNPASTSPEWWKDVDF
ncbi:hypothetical protein ONE63_011285 [Megalurothrips usitatus]|uniref:Uncharacterized protein n=1 Tax=Megalurothrips usitatus TaxID=439358 RepID=A0AAV7X3A6_9NEOP|nr:hypothetical protein ONE63_011285 [Megalurothrips usitatus]